MSLAATGRGILVPGEHSARLRVIVVTAAFVLCILAGTSTQLGLLIAAVVIGTVLLLAISAAPQLGAYALVAANTFESVRILPTAGAMATVTKAVGVLVVAGWTLALVRRRLRSPSLALGAPLGCAVVFVAWSALTSVWALELAPALAKTVTLGLLLMSAIVFATSIDTLPHLRRLAQTHVAFGALVAVISIGSVLTSRSTQVEYESWGTEETVTRTTGFVQDPNEFASAQLFVFSVALALTGTATTGAARLVYGAATAAAAGAIVGSVSRGGLIAFFVVLGLWIVAGRRAVLWGALVGTAIGGLYVAGVFDLVLHRATSYGPDPRLLIWDVGLKLWSDHFAVGVGIGGFPDAFFANQFRSGLVIHSIGRPIVAHNIFLSVAAETGLVGLILWIGLAAVVFWALFRAARWPFNRDVRSLARGYMFGLAGFFVSALFLSAEVDKWLWLTIGLSVVLTRLTMLHSRREIQ
jgi:O-antigen ligase